jgi:dienelactone hydrolase
VGWALGAQPALGPVGLSPDTVGGRVLETWGRRPFEAGDLVHDVYRAGHGPCVLVLSELPGITPRVTAFAERVVDLGCSVAMPHLFGTPGREPSAAYALESLAQVCISREFTGFALGRSGRIITWLRALAAEEHRRCGGPGVGVVGMCYTGGFGLAMMVDDVVVAPVLSQPSLPIQFGAARKRDVQLSEADWQRVRQRAEDGTCVLGLRFTGDKLCPGDRFTRLRQELGERFLAIELDSSPGNPHDHPKAAHSVLTEHLDDREGTPTRAALDQVLAFLSSRLLPAEPPA